MVDLASSKPLMKGHMEVDVTAAREKIKKYKVETGNSQSFTAWFIKCVAQAIAENKQIQAMRKGGKIIIFDDVDVFVLIETNLNGDQAALPYVIRKSDKKSCIEIHKEIRAAQKQCIKSDSIMIGSKSSLLKIYPYLPKKLRMFICRRVTNNPFFVKKNTGTVSVSSVGMMGNMKGIIYPISPLPLSFAVCGITQKAIVINGKVEIREMLNIAFTADHTLIDGAPLARFLSRLTELIENGFDLEKLLFMG
jgi:pyruvate/2-oxoglutarate dehydrogenase complex dihydrolipoamide acyltransferase (E2) component